MSTVVAGKRRYTRVDLMTLEHLTIGGLRYVIAEDDIDTYWEVDYINQVIKIKSGLLNDRANLSVLAAMVCIIQNDVVLTVGSNKKLGDTLLSLFAVGLDSYLETVYWDVDSVIPTCFNLLSKGYNITKVEMPGFISNECHLLGLHHGEKLLIEIISDNHNVPIAKDAMVSTFYHELVHAISYVFLSDDFNDNNEFWIDKMSIILNSMHSQLFKIK